MPADFTISQNYPNPVAGSTSIDLCVPSRDKVSVSVTDIQGRRLISSKMTLDKGYHTFRFTPGGEAVCIFTAFWKNKAKSIKIINSSPNPGIPYRSSASAG